MYHNKRVGGLNKMEYEELLKKLEPYCDTQRVQNIIHNIEKTDTTGEVTREVEELQELCNHLYQMHGMNDIILDFQVYINELRNTYNVTDPRELLKIDDGDGFVQ